MRLWHSKDGEIIYIFTRKNGAENVSFRSIYSGGGYLAQCFHTLNQADRQEEAINKERTRKEFEIEKNNQEQIDRLIESVCKAAKEFEDALFLINGYHLHERQWRKKRQ